MRHFTAITLILMTSLVACRQQNDNDKMIGPAQSIQNSGRAPAPNNNGAPTTQTDGILTSAIDTSNIFARSFTTNTPENATLRQQYPTQYSCSTELCADNFNRFPSIPKLVEKAKTPTAEQKQYYTTYIVPALQKFEQLRDQVNAHRLAVLEAKESAFANAALSDEQLRTLQTFYILRNSKQYPRFAKYWEEVLMKLPLFKASQAYAIMRKWTFLQELYPNLTPQEAAKSELAYLENSLNKMRQTIPGVIHVDPALVAKIQSGATLTTDEAESLSDFSIGIRPLTHFLFDASGKELIEAEMKEHTFTSAELLDIYKQGTLKADLQKKAPSESCEASYYQSINLYPHEAEIEKMKALTAQAQASALSLLSTQDPAYAKVRALKFVFPPSANENSKAWLKSLETESNSAVDIINQLEKADTATIFSQAVIWTLSKLNQDSPGRCPNIPKTIISDLSFQLTDHVQISWYSVRYPEMGVSIAAHEIGHTVFAFSNATEVTKSCLIGIQGGTEQYANEDYADVFAARVANALEKSQGIKAGNFACGFMDNLQDLKNQNQNDPHSSDLFRAVQFALRTNQTLPDSCNQLANQKMPSLLQWCN